MLILGLGFSIIVFYQVAMLRKNKFGKREKLIGFAVTGAVFLYAAMGLFFPDWASPNKPIRFVFEPVQRWLLQIPESPGSSE
ncbi:hypothetical protein [Cohnella yongneupensis]|uniref:Uncharacterized protein n=1 Tax=Cohnella yongneupensis TaxID=425006 RepID=A0ABW0R4S4_9BACL